MKKLLLGVVLIASVATSALFAAGGGGTAEKVLATKQLSGGSSSSDRSQPGDCVFNSISDVLQVSKTAGYPASVVLKSSSPSFAVLQNIQTQTCSSIDGLTLTQGKKNMITVKLVSHGKNYTYVCWLKTGRIVCVM